MNYFDCYPIDGLLRDGENTLAVAVQASGWATFRSSPSVPSLWLDIGDQVRTGPTWKTRPIGGWRVDAPTFTFQYGPMEWVDLADGPDRPPSPTAPDWSPARVIDDHFRAESPRAATLLAKTLVPRDIPPLRESAVSPVAVPRTGWVDAVPLTDDVAKLMQEEIHHPTRDQWPVERLCGDDSGGITVTPEKTGDGAVLVFDFGAEVNGGFLLDLDAPEGVVVDIGYGEHLSDGRVRTVALGYHFADRQITRRGLQQAGTWFDERGFRYVQVVLRRLSGPVTLRRVAAIDRRYPFDRRATFSSDDPELDAIWKLCADTIAVCATDTFVDCPWRENTLYINDLLVENAAALTAFGDGRLTARCLRLAISEADENGLVPASIPNGLQGDMDQATADAYMTFPATQLFLTEIVEDLYLYSGDRATTEVLVEHLAGVLRHLEDWADDDGLLKPPQQHWNFIDWSIDSTQSHALRGQATAAVNWFWVRALDSITRLAEATGVGIEHTDHWQRLAATVTSAIITRFWQQDQQLFLEGARNDSPHSTQVSQALAILSGRLSADQMPLLDAPTLTPAELYMLHPVLQAEVATTGATRALSRIKRHWGAIVASGSATAWECGVTQFGESAFGGAGSLCHGFSTTPLTVLQRTVLGVRPISAGFTEFTVAPQLGHLRRASGSIPTPADDIVVSWHRSGTSVRGRITIPDGLTGVLPDGSRLPGGTHEVRI